jgi:putative N6-adenine-specific DNA methylase
MNSIELIATCAFGLEAVVSRELKQLGYADHTIEDGRIRFVADESAICRTNLWLRSAERVLVQVGSFDVADFGELFDRTNDLPWADWLPITAQFPVSGKSVRSKLHSVPDCQAIVKKAIVEKLKQKYHRKWFDESGATYSIEISILKDRATLSIDTSGQGLHKRGYRKLLGAAPLKETMAAALIQLSYWNRERPFIDPLCGTGTIPIEAALIGRNIAPGLNRAFAAEQWERIPISDWYDARTQAQDEIQDSLAFTLIGTDIDAKVLGMARYHAEQAGVSDSIHWQQKALSEFTTKRYYGCVICNPPYGERMGEQSEVDLLYHQMAEVLRPLDTWSFYILTSNSRFEHYFGRKATRRRKLYNGRIECTYFQFAGPRPPRSTD